MLDPWWQAARNAVLRRLLPSDRLLVPRGDWGEFDCPVRYYDGVIVVDDATVLILHKGRLPGIRKQELGAILDGWQCCFANRVLAVFSRDRKRWIDARYLSLRGHLRRVRCYIESRALKRRSSTLYYVHLPKTGGTSAWSALARVFESSVYYADVEVFSANPPARGEYDLVGLHFSPVVLEGILASGDLLAGMLREPTERFLSGVLHARRAREDVETFTASQRAMRTLGIRDFLATDFGNYEARLQLLALGAQPGIPGDSLTDQVLLARAIAFLDRGDTLFAPSEESRLFIRALAAGIGLGNVPLGRLNANDPGDYQRGTAEIHDALPAIRAKNAAERELYEFARRRFAAQLADFPAGT
jgi:hypothetical protein